MLILHKNYQISIFLRKNFPENVINFRTALEKFIRTIYNIIGTLCIQRKSISYRNILYLKNKEIRYEK